MDLSSKYKKEVNSNVMFRQITKQETVDFIDAFRKFCKKNLVYIANALAEHGENGLTFAELRERTYLDTNALNHALIEMKKEGFVKYSGKQYYLTKYGYTIYSALKQATEMITNIVKNDEDLNINIGPDGHNK
jgi:DNA-binding HxlR family transcriptional regulator